MLLSTFAILWSLFVMAYVTAARIIASMHAVLPWGTDLALLLVVVARITRLRKADEASVDAALCPGGARVRFVAHRGAGLDAPENTINAFKYCVDRGCNFIEFDVRMTADGECVLLHDLTLSRIARLDMDVSGTPWEKIKDIDLSVTHPLQDRYKGAKPALLDEALDYLLQHNVHMFIDVKGKDKRIIEKLVSTFKRRPELYTSAIITSFNPLFIYQIRRADTRIIGALAFRPYCFSAISYNAEEGPGRSTFPDNKLLHYCMRGLDFIYTALWNSTLITSWCGVSAVLLHKDYISQYSVGNWLRRGYRVLAWTVNQPAEKTYFQRVVKVTYLSDTLIGESKEEKPCIDRVSANWDDEPLKIFSSGYAGSPLIQSLPNTTALGELLKPFVLENDIAQNPKSMSLTNGTVDSLNSQEEK